MSGAGEPTAAGHGPVAPGAHSYGSFDAACRAVLRHAHTSFGMGAWFVSRTVGEDYVLLNVAGSTYGLEEGAVMRWEDSLCARVDGPTMLADLPSTPDFDAGPIATGMGLVAYLSVPLYTPDGELFGTMGAVDDHPNRNDMSSALEQLELLGGLLMTVLDAEMRIEAEQRRAERERDAARTDALCGIPNRRAWNDALEREESRCRRYGEPAGIAIIDLDRLKVVNDEQGHAAGDALLRRAAKVLGTVVRESDLVARLGGDEFGVLAPASSSEDLDSLVRRIAVSLRAAGVAASVGARTRRPDMTLLETWHHADRAMYRNKAELAVDRGR